MICSSRASDVECSVNDMSPKLYLYYVSSVTADEPRDTVCTGCAAGLYDLN